MDLNSLKTRDLFSEYPNIIEIFSRESSNSYNTPVLYDYSIFKSDEISETFFEFLNKVLISSSPSENQDFDLFTGVSYESEYWGEDLRILYKDLRDSDEGKQKVKAFLKRISKTKELPVLFRSQKRNALEPHFDIDRMLPDPKKVKKQGRWNDVGEAVIYTSSCKKTAINETKSKECYTMISFKPDIFFSVLDLKGIQKRNPFLSSDILEDISIGKLLLDFINILNNPGTETYDDLRIVSNLIKESKVGVIEHYSTINKNKINYVILDHKLWKSYWLKKFYHFDNIKHSSK